MAIKRTLTEACAPTVTGTQGASVLTPLTCPFGGATISSSPRQTKTSVFPVLVTVLVETIFKFRLDVAPIMSQAQPATLSLTLGSLNGAQSVNYAWSDSTKFVDVSSHSKVVVDTKTYNIVGDETKKVHTFNFDAPTSLCKPSPGRPRPV